MIVKNIKSFKSFFDSSQRRPVCMYRGWFIFANNFIAPHSFNKNVFSVQMLLNLYLCFNDGIESLRFSSYTGLKPALQTTEAHCSDYLMKFSQCYQNIIF